MESLSTLRKRTEPLICMLNSQEVWPKKFAESLIIVVEQNTPNQSSKIVYGKCAAAGFHKNIADTIAHAARILAKIRKEYGKQTFSEIVYGK